MQRDEAKIFEILLAESEVENRSTYSWMFEGTVYVSNTNKFFFREATETLAHALIYDI